MKSSSRALYLAAAALAVGCASSPKVISSDALRTALANPGRADADKARDAGRMPVDVIAFLEIGQGTTVVDLIAAGGYYTEVLSYAVGDEGTVYAQNPAFVLQFRDGANDKALTARLAGDRLPNVERWDRELDDLGLEADSVDAALTALNFHDLDNRDPERAARMLAVVMHVLKPGSVLGVIDHIGDPGNDNAELHRIVEARVVEAVTAAGFDVAATSDLLRNGADDRSKSVFDPSVRGQTDRFLLKLRKPL